MIKLSSFVIDEPGDRAEARLYVDDLSKWTALWASQGVKDAKPELVKAIVELVIAEQREQIAALLTPEAIGKAVHEGLVQAVAQVITGRQKNG